MKKEIFKIKVWADNKPFGEDIHEYTSYETAKKRLKEIAEDLAFQWQELGKTITCKCTFGGFSKDATPISEGDRAEHKDAVLLHVQRVRTNNKETRYIYELYLAQ